MWFSLLYLALKMEKGDADRQRVEAWAKKKFA
jgi:hypothetical protein